jgi:mono/diheme cytochrome c family protein
VLHGLDGPIDLKGQPVVQADPLPMPPMAGLEDQQLADVLSYLRADFAPTSPAVTAADVRSVRLATSGRETPWTAKELEA